MSGTDNSYQLHLADDTEYRSCLLCNYQQHVGHHLGCVGCMHACPRFLHLGVTVDSNALFYVLLLPTGLKQCSLCIQGGLSPWSQRGSGRAGPWGEAHVCPSLQDADHGCQYVTSQGRNDKWLPAKDASLHAG